MLNPKFTASDLEALRYHQRHHPHPRVQLKMRAVLMKAKGLPHHQICEIVGISGNTLRSYLRDFVGGGVERLMQLSFYKPTAKLDAYQDKLKKHFEQHPPVSAAHARKEITRLTGVTRGLTQVRVTMHRLGLRFRKVGAIPAKADPVEQDEFKKNSWNPGWQRPRLASAPSTL